ncbi:MAG: M28 family metallopeptidase [Pseudomonadota bacterium]
MKYIQVLVCLCAFALTGCGGDEPRSSGDPASRGISDPTTAYRVASLGFPDAPVDETTLRRHLETLASDDFEGRAPATSGGERTRDYLINEAKRIGLKPGVGEGYEQTVPLVEVTLDPKQSEFTVDGEPLKYGDEAIYWTKRVVDAVAFDDSDMVFVGYGVVAPEYGWNDYEGLDVTGKTVVMLVNDPGFATGDAALFNGRAMTYYGRWTYKYEEAARQGAAAAIIVHQTEPAAYGWSVISGWMGPQLDLERPDGGAGRTVLEGWITEEKARSLFSSAGLDFDKQAQAALDRSFNPTPMGALKASGKITNNIRRNQSANIAAVLPGAKRPDEFILYMAHWDHLGRNFGQPGGDSIANGAVDNATGTAGVLTIAEAFANNGVAPDRSILFLFVTAEESGLLGSAYFGEAPIVPLAKIVGGVNIDAILPTPPAKDITVIGFGASELETILERAALRRGLYLRPDAQPEKGYFYRSDHISLAKKGVPMLYADSGIDLMEGGEEAGLAFSDDYTENRYHKPADEYKVEWNVEGLTQTLGVLYEVGADMAYSNDWPNWFEGNEFRALRDAQRAAVAGG